MEKILTAALHLIDEGKACVLSLIIREEGSSPRGTGSIMLTAENGLVEGTIGGGAVEKDAVEISLGLIGGTVRSVREYTLHQGTEQDLGMVCGGSVSVLFVPIQGHDAKWKNILTEALTFCGRMQRSWLILDTKSSLSALADHEKRSAAGDRFENAVLSEGCVLVNGVFSMPLSSCERAVIFGGGHCCRALVPVLKSVGFEVTVMDCREEYVSPLMHPAADELICGDFGQIGRYIDITPEDFCVIMTNGHTFDMIVEYQLLTGPAAYIGVIGSKSKTAAVNAQLKEKGIKEEALSAVHTPIGTDIKAVTPEEIAISIAGELILERALRRESAGFLTHSCPMH